MKPLSERSWSDDFEIVYEIKQPYVHLLQQLSAIAEGFAITAIEEAWFFGNDETYIRIRYAANGRRHELWTARRGDFLNVHVVGLINLQLGLADPKFETASEAHAVYFISAGEKETLEQGGTRFDAPGLPYFFEFLLDNAARMLDSGATAGAYGCIATMNAQADAYRDAMWRHRRLKEIQEMLRVQVLEKIRWDEAALPLPETEALYRLAAG